MPLKKCKRAPTGKKLRCNLPSGSKWNYVEGVLPLLETEKVTLCGITKLDYRDTHEIRRLELIDDPEEPKKARNDDLYRVFG